MPYSDIAELPDSVKHVLPEHALHIYLEAYNHAWDEYQDAGSRKGNASREEVARRVAWAAVKKVYEKDQQTGMWAGKR